MTITRLYTRTTADLADGTKVDADYDNIINELNSHTTGVDPHTVYLLKTGGTLTGQVSVAIAGTDGALALSSAATTNDVLAITGSSLTTGTCAYVYSSSADVSDRNLIYVNNDNAAAVLTTLLKLKQDATMTAGSGVLEIYNGASLKLYIPETGVVYAQGVVI